MKIAVSGKGGVGKTTVAATLARVLKNNGFRVFAVDADPDTSLGQALGISDERLASISPVAMMKSLINTTLGNGAMFTLNPDLSDDLKKFIIDHDGISFLRMGDVKRGGSDCYCKENTYLKALVNSLLLDTDDAVILDMGAGIEHLTRGTASAVDLMLIVTEPGKASLQTARTVEKLAREIKVGRILYIANKVRNDTEAAFINSNFSPDELIGIVPYDGKIAESSIGMGDSPGVAVNTELERLLDNFVKSWNTLHKNGGK